MRDVIHQISSTLFLSNCGFRTSYYVESLISLKIKENMKETTRKTSDQNLLHFYAWWRFIAFCFALDWWRIFLIFFNQSKSVFYIFSAGTWVAVLGSQYRKKKKFRPKWFCNPLGSIVPSIGMNVMRIMVTISLRFNRKYPLLGCRSEFSKKVIDCTANQFK